MWPVRNGQGLLLGAVLSHGVWVCLRTNARTCQPVAGGPRDLVEVVLGPKQVVFDQVAIETHFFAGPQRHFAAAAAASVL
jgi:hypothetical protein